MNFQPAKNSIRSLIIAFLIVLDAILIGLYFLLMASSVRSLIVFTLIISNIYLLYHLLQLITLNYHFSERGLVILAFFDLKKIEIPKSDLLAWSREITLLKVNPPGLSAARFAFGKGYDKEGGKTNNFITNSKNAIYLRTPYQSYGISPHNVDAFIKLIESYEIPYQALSSTPLIIPGEKRQKNHLHQLTLMCVALASALFLIPLLTDSLGLLPEWVKISEGQFLPKAAYMEDVFIREIMVFVGTLFMYAIIILLSGIEHSFYSRLMYLPLIAILILLFFELNVQLINIFDATRASDLPRVLTAGAGFLI